MINDGDKTRFQQVLNYYYDNIFIFNAIICLTSCHGRSLIRLWHRITHLVGTFTNGRCRYIMIYLTVQVRLWCILFLSLFDTSRHYIIFLYMYLFFKCLLKNIVYFLTNGEGGAKRISLFLRQQQLYCMCIYIQHNIILYYNMKLFTIHYMNLEKHFCSLWPCNVQKVQFALCISNDKTITFIQKTDLKIKRCEKRLDLETDI